MKGTIIHSGINLFIALVPFVLLLAHCANPVAPVGGIKDTTPPQIIAIYPSNGFTGFQEMQIRLVFDEFVQLKNVNDEVFISPPMEVPDFKIKGKSVVITFQDPLEDSTTYSVFLGKSIADLNEGNVVPYFTYVFSTGPVLDSMSIMGEVISADGRKPQKDALVMLYKSAYDTIPLDSVPYLIRPLYVTRTIEEGVFVMNNLRPGKYKIFALNDINKNFLFDLPNEDIAFLDSLIIPRFYASPVIDSMLPEVQGQDPDSVSSLVDSGYYLLNGTDTIVVFNEVSGTDTTGILPSDTLLMDTLSFMVEYDHYQLFMFREVDSTQRLLEARLDKEGLLRFVFRFRMKDPRIIVIDTVIDPGWKITEWNRGMDTLKYWIPKVFTDSLVFFISDDTLILDTLKLPLKQVDRKGRTRKGDAKPEPLSYITNLRGGKMDLNGKASMIFEYPVVLYDFSGIILIEETDTQFFQPVFTDAGIQRKLLFDISWKESTSYEIIIPDSIITDMTGRQNDSLNFRFSTLSQEDYGILRLDVRIDDSLSPYILQLLDEKDKVLEEEIVFRDGRIVFDYLKPAKYRIKAIQDRNRNRRWDSGNYLQKVQPEKVFYFPEPIEVRANWEMEEEWLLKPD